jgi:type I restriction enzyme M protein
MNSTVHSSIVNFIWGIADDCLRDIYVRGKYRDVILPMTVIRRLDAILEPTKDAVRKMKENLDAAGITNQEAALCQAAGQPFYNSSQFTLRDLKARAKQQQLKADFEAYLDGFSPNVQEILDNFEFRNQIPKLSKADILGLLIEKFLDPSINLSPNPICDGEGRELLPKLDNHDMGMVFEELIRRFNEENNEEAGEHFTPRDVVELMANLIFLPIAPQIEDTTYLVYDGACGTGGMLTVAEETLYKLAIQHGKDVSIHLYGQEINPETYAICKADLLLKGEGQAADNIVGGSDKSTLSADAFPSREFDFMLSNPPYGKSWKADLERLGGKSEIKDPRFVIDHADDPEYNLVTRSSDGQLMFLVNKLSKMKQQSPLGSRIAEVHNGSSLFTGDAGSGESNIRRWILENDWLEAIVALPENMFYNTGIATYVWVLSNRKTPERKGKVQLINAAGWYAPLRKNLGKKNCRFEEEHIRKICDLFINMDETEQSKVFPNEAFGYWKITVDRPLRYSVDLSETTLANLQKADDKPFAELVADLVKTELGGETRFSDYNQTWKKLSDLAGQRSLKLTAKREKLFREHCCSVDETAEPVVKKVHKPGKVEANPLYGKFAVKMDGKPCVVEYEPDSSLRDTEQVPLLEEGGIEAFFQREVLPYVPDAWIDAEKTQVGYEISFTRHFYKPTPLRTLEEIRADILALEQETEGLLEDIVKVES